MDLWWWCRPLVLPGTCGASITRIWQRGRNAHRGGLRVLHLVRVSHARLRVALTGEQTCTGVRGVGIQARELGEAVPESDIIAGPASGEGWAPIWSRPVASSQVRREAFRDFADGSVSWPMPSRR